MKLTVYFDEQYWVGVVEAEKKGQMVIARHVFGPEPSNPDVLSFVLRDLDQLIDQSLSMPSAKRTRRPRKRINAKRLRRMAEKESRSSGIGTKAQKALKEAFEQKKKINHAHKREEREILKKQEYQLRKKKARLRHRGKA
ncbi:YjdF family protein [Sporolactobacillus shoreicorticis]|uniref:YjdF family protein n=1 Tax=Sporolactobacillus shoreicorticis TaxID=1923877 RepID=A0ABW5S9A6_9BACL|nr:YjdF family protein [Sporolactobacillus shoreicorticis]MCO7126950.1 YjdF family protein [Sporolactobacillus shoreicorticis]